MKEALKAAIKAMGNSNSISYEMMHVIADCKEALAQQEQEPLAKVEPCAVCGEGKARLLVLRSCDTCHSEYAGQAEMKVALGRPEQKPVEDVVAYHSDGTRTVRIAPQRPWVGLTDEEIKDCMGMSIQKTCRAIEAALRSKNT